MERSNSPSLKVYVNTGKNKDYDSEGVRSNKFKCRKYIRMQNDYLTKLKL